jgi:hypothetical protein
MMENFENVIRTGVGQLTRICLRFASDSLGPSRMELEALGGHA